jgi:hypothetical protein
MKKTLVAILLAAASPAAYAWGPLGHRVVAETAALLVEDDLPATWGPLLARHRFELGVYAFLPDASFRHEDGAGGTIEGPTHFLNLDAPVAATANRGTVDRRVVQFLELASEQLKDVRAPKGAYLRGATAQGDARRVYLGLYLLGVMAHYSGDVSMPYHATSDFNGYAVGEGGIHFYFESDCVDALEPGLSKDVLAAARKNRARWLAAWKSDAQHPAELVRAVLFDSLSAVPVVSELDRRHAVTKMQGPGSTRDALRKPPATGCRAMRAVLVSRLARGAVLTAALWESVLPKDVDFSSATDLQFSDMELGAAYEPPN